jgi:DNA primase
MASMARVPSEEIAKLEREVSLERLAVAKGVVLVAKGKDLVGLCPFCGADGQTLLLTPADNTWRCEAGCQAAGGRVLDWVMRAEGVSRRLAVELLRSDLGTLEAFSAQKRGRQKGRVAEKSTTPKLGGFETSAADHVLLRNVFDYYHATLKESPEALGYLEKRGLKSAEMIERFRLGFANRTLAYRLPQKNRKEGAEVRGRLQKLGVLRESGHEHLNGSLVVPVLDAEGRIVDAYGRKITPGLRPGTPQHSWLGDERRGVWNAKALTASRSVILCASLIDALSFWCAGFRNVTAIAGLDGPLDEHAAAFVKAGVGQAMIAFRRSPEGDGAAEKVAARVGEAGLECFRVVFPKGMDANDFLLKAPGGFEALIRQAEWLGKGKAKTAAVEAPVNTAVPMPTFETADEPLVDAPVAQATVTATSQRAHRGEGDTSTAREPTPPSGVSPAAASVAPTPTPVASPRTTASTDEVTLVLGERQWRIRGLAKNAGLEALKVNLLVSREGAGFHVDTLELYSARQRQQYATLAAHELCVDEQVIKRDLGSVLLRLEELQEHAAKKSADDKSPRPKLSDEERQAALALLRDPRLVDRILDDLDRLGVVGERTNKLVAYLAATSRLLDEPLAVVVQAASAGGKSSLMEAVLALVPEEDRVQYSAMTGQSLFYLGEADLKHKVLAIAEDEGAERAAYALKLLQSEGQLTIASTGKDQTTGRLVTQEYRVEGPVALMLTTTAVDVDEELLNRSLVLTVDEGREQTRAIHDRQRAAQTLEGVLAKHDRPALLKLHRDAQRLLRPMLVVNPFARELTFLDHATRTRRDHMKYLTLIRTIALLHQHQRPVRVVEHRGQRLEYLEVTRDDVELANRICHEVLGRSLDELPPQTRALLGELDVLVRAACERLSTARADYRFTRREVREATGLGNTQLKVHLARLVELEYVLVHRGKQGQGYVYELAYDGRGKDGGAFLPGLEPVGPVEQAATTTTSRGHDADFAGVGRGLDGAETPGGRSDETASMPRDSADLRADTAPARESPRSRASSAGTAYVAESESAA